MKKWIVLFLVLVLGIPVQAKDEPTELYAQSAVLMDADSGRVLFEKNGMEFFNGNIVTWFSLLLYR